MTRRRIVPLFVLIPLTVSLQVIQRYATFSWRRTNSHEATGPRMALKARKRKRSQPIQANPRSSVGSYLVNSDSSRHLVDDPDNVRRRQLLLSFLTTMTASPLLTQGVQVVNAQDAAIEELGNGKIIKPPLDDRECVTYTLPNGLRVLLCSDPSSNEAAAAMDVHVGACSDPPDVPGLAHFLEHMLFLGTKNNPKEDSFESFLASNGGRSNAFTDSENTVFYFEMEAEAGNRIAEGLSRFGSFFSAPLFTESATGRELNAIESENAKNLQTDSFRYFQMAKARANPEHPFSKFFTGNKKTLLDDTKAKGIDLRQELIKFYNRYYSANQMTLAVVAPQPIETLRKMVKEAFGAVPDRQVAKPEKAWTGVMPFGAPGSVVPSFGAVLEMVPVQDLRQVTITWPILYRDEKNRRDSVLVKPANYVAHLIGHEGPRSLLSFLKRRGWANSVAVGTEEQLSDFETIEVVVGLTTQGLVAVDDVVEAVFSYIQLMRDRTVPSYIFEEVLQLDELQWRFLTKGNAGNYVQSLVSAMQKYPPELYVAGPRRLALEDYNAYPPLTGSPRPGFTTKEQLENTRAQVDRYARSLTADNAMITVLSKAFEGFVDRKEIWYGTDYRIRPIDAATMDRWRNPAAASKLKIDFPNPNPFIPTEAGLLVKIEPDPSLKERKRSFESRMEPVPPPVLIRDDGPDGQWTVHYRQDDRFGQPKAYMIFEILTREVYSSPLGAALANLVEVCVSDRLGEYAYDAGLAGLMYDVKVLPRGVRLTFGGYNAKLKDFAAYITKKLTKDIGDVLPKDDTDFGRYKDQIMRALSAFDVKQPYMHASYYAQLTLQPRRFQYSNADLRDATRKITLPDLVSYMKRLFSSGKGEALVQGNLDVKEALDLVEIVGDAIHFKPIPSSEYPPRLEALPLPPSSFVTLPVRLLIAEPNPFNENSVAYVLLQSLGLSEQDHVMLELVSAIVEEPFYNDLRTKKQLGYIVSSGIRGIGDTRTLAFVVQSSVATADDLAIEILAFLDAVQDDILVKLSKGDLAVYAKSLIDRKTEPDKDLIAEVTRNWSEIASGRFQFDRIQREAAALLDVNKESLLQFWKTIYAGDGRRVLVSEVIPRRGAAASDLPPTTFRYSPSDLMRDELTLGIDDLEQFRRDREKLLATAVAALA